MAQKVGDQKQSRGGGGDGPSVLFLFGLSALRQRPEAISSNLFSTHESNIKAVPSLFTVLLEQRFLYLKKTQQIES